MNRCLYLPYGAKIAGASPVAPAKPTKSCVPLPSSFFGLPVRQLLVPRRGFFLDACTHGCRRDYQRQRRNTRFDCDTGILHTNSTGLISKWHWPIHRIGWRCVLWRQFLLSIKIWCVLDEWKFVVACSGLAYLPQPTCSSNSHALPSFLLRCTQGSAARECKKLYVTDDY